jgi:RNA polymerase sigma-70 factor (ECF subfamily)
MNSTTTATPFPGLLVTEKVEEHTPQVDEDARLVQRSIEGDEAAFRRLVEKYRRAAYRTAYGFLRDEHLSNDISQEAFVRVFRNLRSYDPSHAFSTWLRRITVNLAIDELRRQQRRPEAPLDETDVSRTLRDPVREAEIAEEHQAVWEILEALPLKYRTIMVLREIGQLPTKEVAKIVGRPEVSVRWRLHQARKLFREKWLARYGES